MKSSKIEAGSQFPEIKAQSLDGESVALHRRTNGADWKMVVVYRGKHCPLCTKYLNQLETFKNELEGIGVDTVAVSGDSEAQLKEHSKSSTSAFRFYTT